MPAVGFHRGKTTFAACSEHAGEAWFSRGRSWLQRLSLVLGLPLPSFRLISFGLRLGLLLLTGAWACTAWGQVNPSLSFREVTTFAGSGAASYLDGTGTAAAFNGPLGIAIDNADNLYVADGFNYRIRKITPAGVVTTLAGRLAGSANGTGTGASFRYLGQIAWDSVNNVLYVADTDNFKIRKITLPGAVVTTLAGSGTSGFSEGTGTGASFSYPVGIAWDASTGNIYVGDKDDRDSIGTIHSRIWQVTPGGVVTTLAGSGPRGYVEGIGTAAQLYYPDVLVSDGSGNLYARSGNLIMKVTTSGGVATIFAGGGGVYGSIDTTNPRTSSFRGPRGFAMDRAGNLFVSEYQGYKIRCISPTGVISTVAGTGSSGFADGIGMNAAFAAPRQMAIDSTGNVYVADTNNNRIRKIAIANTTVGYSPTNTLNKPVSSTYTGGSYGAISYTSSNASVGTVSASGVVTIVELGATTITATQAEVTGVNTAATTSYVLTVVKGTPTITWATPLAISQNRALTATQLNATADVAGTFAYTPALGTIMSSLGNQTLSVTFTPTDAAHYNSVTATVTLDVNNKATPTITTAPTASSITYGQTLVSSSLIGGTASVAGTFAFSSLSTVPNAGTATQAVTFTPSDTINYNTTTTTVNVTVTKVTPTITVAPTASGITYGQTLASSTLSGGTASVAGTFTFTTPSTVPGLGTATQGVTFTPSDTTNYNTATTTVNVTVAKATPTITVAPAASGITYGQTLVSSTLSGGSASVAGVFAFTTSSTAPGAGTATQAVTFTPSDTTNYTTATTTVNVTVAKATPTITAAPTASEITYGQTLGSSTLSGGTASVAGTFAFTTLSTAPGAGTATQAVTFTPSDTTNYNTATTTVNMTVAKATPTITAAPTASGIAYGQTLASSTLSGGTASVAGTFAFTNPSTVPAAGTAGQAVTFTPSDTTNYNVATTTVNVTVAKATPTITWATPSAITYGIALSATQLNATSTLAGAFTYSPASGTIPSAGTQTLTATFIPTDEANYNTVTGNVVLVVAKATPTITWATPSDLAYGTALSAMQLNATCPVPGTFLYNPAAGIVLPVGLAPLRATFTPTDTSNYRTVDVAVELLVVQPRPTAPTGVVVSANAGEVIVSFNAPSYTGTSPISAYTILATASDGTTVSVTTTGSPVKITGLILGKSYRFTVTAINRTGPGESSAATDAVTISRLEQTIRFDGLADRLSNSEAFTLNAVASSGLPVNFKVLSGPAQLQGNVVTLTGENGIVKLVASQPGDATYAAAPDVVQAFTVTAFIKPLPGAPTGVKVSVNEDRLEATVSFSAPSAAGSTPITAYLIRATASDGSSFTVTTTESPAKITGLARGKVYVFTVTAVNNAGAGDNSDFSDAIFIKLLEQSIRFTPLADCSSNSGSFALKASASSGLPVSFAVLSGPAMLQGNIIDLTGASGVVRVRASQSGDATYAAASDVDLAFTVSPGATQVIFTQVINPTTHATEANLALVLPINSRRGTLLIVSDVYPNLNGRVEIQLGTSGSFTSSITPLSATSSVTDNSRPVQAAPLVYTISGTLLDYTFSGTVSGLGLVYQSEVLASATSTNPQVGFFRLAGLIENRGLAYTVIGPKGDLLVLAQAGAVVTGGLTTLKSNNTFALTTYPQAGKVAIQGGFQSGTYAFTTTLKLPTQETFDYAGLNIATKRTDRLINLSSRAKVGTGESILIAGFVVSGADPKKVLIRAVGPALGAFGLAETLPNPAIKIYQGERLIAENDDWNRTDAAEMARVGAFALTGAANESRSSSEAIGKDAALITTLNPGAYTAQIADVSGTGSGVALAEIYDASLNPNADYQRLVNISSRGLVTPDDGVLIGGFVVTGNAPKTLLIRGVGPGLTSFGVAGALADPALTVYQDTQPLATNEGWANRADIATAAIQTGAFALPSGSKDAAVLVTLKPGAYTAQIKSAKNASSGVALIEIYEVP